MATYDQTNSVQGHIRPAVFHKTYDYHVWDGDTFKTTWTNEVFSEPTFRTVINGGPGELVIKLDREFDNFGEDEDIALYNKVEVYCYDADAPNGLLLYTGFISGYRPILDGPKEYIEVTLLPYIKELSEIMLRDGSNNTEIAMNSTDPSTMFKNVIDYYRDDGGEIDYTDDSVDNTNTTVSYTFRTYTTKESLDKIVELTPQDWYWLIEADNTAHLHESDLVNADHDFILGRQVERLTTWRRGEDIVNKVYFVGEEDETTGENLYRVYENSASITAYGIHAEKYVDQRVSTAATADILANRIIDKKKDPEIRTTMRIMDNNGANKNRGYDIESIRPGDTMRIKNIKQGVKTITLWDQFVWDEDVWDQTLASEAADVIQIQSVEYNPDYVVIEASSRIPEIQKRIEDIKRNWEQSNTVNTPTQPTVVE